MQWAAALPYPAPPPRHTLLNLHGSPNIHETFFMLIVFHLTINFQIALPCLFTETFVINVHVKYPNCQIFSFYTPLPRNSTSIMRMTKFLYTLRDLGAIQHTNKINCFIAVIDLAEANGSIHIWSKFYNI